MLEFQECTERELCLCSDRVGALEPQVGVRCPWLPSAYSSPPRGWGHPVRRKSVMDGEKDREISHQSLSETNEVPAGENEFNFLPIQVSLESEQ